MADGYTARLNPRQSVEENRDQHVAEFKSYLGGLDFPRLAMAYQTVLNGLSSWSGEDWKTQAHKLSAVVAEASARFPGQDLIHV